jgi:hypothetical protein
VLAQCEPHDNELCGDDVQWALSRHHYLKGGFVREYSSGLITLLAEEVRPEAGTHMYFQSANGAVADVPQAAAAFSHRSVIANMMLAGSWKDPVQDGPGRKAIHAIWDKLAPFTEGYYVNLNDTDAKDKRNGQQLRPELHPLSHIKEAV